MGHGDDNKSDNKKGKKDKDRGEESKLDMTSLELLGIFEHTSDDASFDKELNTFNRSDLENAPPPFPHGAVPPESNSKEVVEEEKEAEEQEEELSFTAVQELPDLPKHMEAKKDELFSPSLPEDPMHPEGSDDPFPEISITDDDVDSDEVFQRKIEGTLTHEDFPMPSEIPDWPHDEQEIEQELKQDLEPDIFSPPEDSSPFETEKFESALPSKKNVKYDLEQGPEEKQDQTEDQEKEQEHTTESKIDYHSKSSLEDIREFGENATSVADDTPLVSGGGGPYFSIIIHNIRFKEEASDILDILKTHKIISDEKMAFTAIENGHIIIPQISEYAAIFLLHQLRRFAIELKMGPSEEIHPSHYYTQSAPPVSKLSLKQNRHEYHLFRKGGRSVEDVIITTTPYVVHSEITKYLGIVTETMIISEGELFTGENVPPLDEEDLHLAKYFPKLEEKYQALSEKLKFKSYQMHGDAVVGVHYQLTPLITEEHQEVKRCYQLSCSGSVVLIT